MPGCSMSDQLDSIRAEMKTIPTARLRLEIADGLRISAERIARCACAVAEIETRGEKVTGVPSGLLSLLRKVAAGKLLPNLMERLAAEPTKLDRAAKLPVETQARIASGEMVLPPINRGRDRAQNSAAGPKSHGKSLDDLLTQACDSHPRDLADMIASMILRNNRPADVLAALERDKRIRDLKAARAAS